MHKQRIQLHQILLINNVQSWALLSWYDFWFNFGAIFSFIWKQQHHVFAFQKETKQVVYINYIINTNIQHNFTLFFIHENRQKLLNDVFHTTKFFPSKLYVFLLLLFLSSTIIITIIIIIIIKTIFNKKKQQSFYILPVLLPKNVLMYALK